MTKPPIITLHRGFPAKKRYTWSPFVTKLECRFRLNNLNYISDKGSIRNGPRGKIPYITLQQNDTVKKIGDSDIITKLLINEGLLQDLNKKLVEQERAKDMAIKALLEEKLYFCNAFEKWHLNYPVMRDHIFASVPMPLRSVVGYLAYRKNKRSLWGQGIARFSDEEVREMQEEVWCSVDAFVSAGGKGEGWVLGGREPTEVDASVYGFVVGALVCDAAPESRELVRGFPALMRYAERIHHDYFPDYEKWDC